MDEFEAIATQLTTEAFQSLTKAVNSLSEDERQRYAETFPIRIWIVAGMDKDNSFAISAN